MTDIENMFDHIVEDPFYSNKFNGMVRVDDFSRVWVDNRHTLALDEYDTDIISDLYFEWASYNGDV